MAYKALVNVAKNKKKDKTKSPDYLKKYLYKKTDNENEYNLKHTKIEKILLK